MSATITEITLFGGPGTGTTSSGMIIAERLGLTFHSTGNMFRKLATDKGLELFELEELAKTDPSIDLTIDDRMRHLQMHGSKFLVDSRLAWHFIPRSFKICFHCTEEMAALRISRRDKISLDEARTKNALRSAILAERAWIHYGIEDLFNFGNFDIVIVTDDGNSEQMAEKCIRQILQHPELTAI